MKSFINFIKWVGAVAATGAMLVAVPVILILGPSPLDPDRGVWALLTALVDGSQVFDESVVSAIVGIGWGLWAYVVVAFLLEVFATIGGAASRNIRGLSFGQSIARPLVAALMWSSTASTMAMSVIGAGGAVAVTSEIAHAAEVPIQVQGWSVHATAMSGHVYVMNNHSDDDGDSKMPEPIVINQEEGTMMVDGQVVRPHVVVIKDDTMWDLAEKHLGDPYRWTEIAALNLGRPQEHSPTVTDPDLIWPQTVLLMPGDAVGLNMPAPAVIEEPPAEEIVLPEPDCAPEITVWTPETDSATNDLAPPAGDTGDTGDTAGTDIVSTAGRDEFGVNAGIPWWLLAAGVSAGAVFAAGMVRLVARRRDRDQALGLGVDEGSELEALLGELDEPQPELRTHLLSAAASLRADLVGADAPMLQVDSDKTTAVFTQVVHPRDGSRWKYSGDDGQRAVWELEHSDAPDFSPSGGSALYGVGDNMFLNLEAIGWLGVEGEADLVAGHLRHLVHDLVGNFGQEHEVVLRIGKPGMIMGADVYKSATETSAEAMRAEVGEYIRQADEAHAMGRTALAAELREDGVWPTLVLVLDLQEVDRLADLIEPLHRFPGRYPIAVVSSGVSSEAPWTARINSVAEMAIVSAYLGKAPRVKPLIMTESTGEALAAELRGQLSKRRWKVEAPALVAPTNVAVGDGDDGMGWYEEVIGQYIDVDAPPEAVTDQKVGRLNGAHDLDALDVLENPYPGQRLPYEPPKHKLKESINPRFTAAKLAQLRGFAPDEPNLYFDDDDDDEDLVDDDDVDAVLAAREPERPQVRILGRPEIGGVNGKLGERALAAATLLSLTPDGLDRSQIRDHIWGGRDVDDRTVRRVLSELQIAFGSAVDRSGPIIKLSVDTDLAELERRITQSCELPWTEASALIAETLELVRGQPFQALSESDCWEWVDSEGAQVRRKVIERVDNALTIAAERAQGEDDWMTTKQLAEIGLQLTPLSQRMVTYAATSLALAGDAAAAVALVARWENDYEATFDEDPPSGVRDQVRAITQPKISG